MKVSIIIPAYNEEKRIAPCLNDLLDFFELQQMDYEIIISEDGSTDRTCHIVQDYASNNNKIRLLHYKERMGKGGGILRGAEVAEGEVAIIMDADLSVKSDQIPKLLEAIEKGADIAIGSRALPDSKLVVRPPHHRVILGKAFNSFFRCLFNLDIHDTQCGFKAVKTKVLRHLMDRVVIEGFAFDIDLIVEAVQNDFKVTEVPIVWRYCEGSKVSVLKQSYCMARDLMIVFLKKKAQNVTIARTETSLKRFYDNIPGDSYYRATHSLFIPRRYWHRMKNRKVIESIGSDSVTVLDAGSGSGTLIQSLMKKSPVLNYYGVDLGKRFIRYTHERYGHLNARFINSDIRFLPFRRDVFDIIVCSEVIEHLSRPEGAIEEFRRVLKPGGKLIITTPNCSLRWSILEAIWTRVRGRMLEVDHRTFTRQRLRYMLSKHSYVGILVKTFMVGCLLLVTAHKPKN